MGKVHTGRVKLGDAVKAMARDGGGGGEEQQGKVLKLFCQRVSVCVGPVQTRMD